jgi:hypothetical protein
LWIEGVAWSAQWIPMAVNLNFLDLKNAQPQTKCLVCTKYGKNLFIGAVNVWI